MSYWNQYKFAITAGGNTVFERIAAGVPGMTINQLLRQNQFSDFFALKGLNTNLGMWNDYCEESLAKHLAMYASESFPHILPPKPRPIDGRGGLRVASHIIEMMKHA